MFVAFNLYFFRKSSVYIFSGILSSHKLFVLIFSSSAILHISLKIAVSWSVLDSVMYFFVSSNFFIGNPILEINSIDVSVLLGLLFGIYEAPDQPSLS